LRGAQFAPGRGSAPLSAHANPVEGWARAQPLDGLLERRRPADWRVLQGRWADRWTDRPLERLGAVPYRAAGVTGRSGAAGPAEPGRPSGNGHLLALSGAAGAWPSAVRRVDSDAGSAACAGCFAGPKRALPTPHCVRRCDCGTSHSAMRSKQTVEALADTSSQFSSVV
jgi:hypothetical protein